MKEECFGNAYEDCDKKAEYIRHTQFAGSHYLCEPHAQEDENFMKNDSYTCWVKLKEI